MTATSEHHYQHSRGIIKSTVNAVKGCCGGASTTHASEQPHSANHGSPRRSPTPVRLHLPSTPSPPLSALAVHQASRPPRWNPFQWTPTPSGPSSDLGSPRSARSMSSFSSSGPSRWHPATVSTELSSSDTSDTPDRNIRIADKLPVPSYYDKGKEKAATSTSPAASSSRSSSSPTEPSSLVTPGTGPSGAKSPSHRRGYPVESRGIIKSVTNAVKGCCTAPSTVSQHSSASTDEHSASCPQHSPPRNSYHSSQGWSPPGAHRYLPVFSSTSSSQRPVHTGQSQAHSPVWSLTPTPSGPSSPLSGSSPKSPKSMSSFSSSGKWHEHPLDPSTETSSTSSSSGAPHRPLSTEKLPVPSYYDKGKGKAVSSPRPAASPARSSSTSSGRFLTKKVTSGAGPSGTKSPPHRRGYQLDPVESTASSPGRPSGTLSTAKLPMPLYYDRAKGKLVLSASSAAGHDSSSSSLSGRFLTKQVTSGAGPSGTKRPTRRSRFFPFHLVETRGMFKSTMNAIAGCCKAPATAPPHSSTTEQRAASSSHRSPSVHQGHLLAPSWPPSSSPSSASSHGPPFVMPEGGHPFLQSSPSTASGPSTNLGGSSKSFSHHPSFSSSGPSGWHPEVPSTPPSSGPASPLGSLLGTPSHGEKGEHKAEGSASPAPSAGSLSSSSGRLKHAASGAGSSGTKHLRRWSLDHTVSARGLFKSAVNAVKSCCSASSPAPQRSPANDSHPTPANNHSPAQSPPSPPAHQPLDRSRSHPLYLWDQPPSVPSSSLGGSSPNSKSMSSFSSSGPSRWHYLVPSTRANSFGSSDFGSPAPLRIGSPKSQRASTDISKGKGKAVGPPSSASSSSSPGAGPSGTKSPHRSSH
ncbi:unnamed protein product [Sympodiomycopsis kandeliae]